MRKIIFCTTYTFFFLLFLPPIVPAAIAQAAPTIPNQETLDQIKQEGQFFSIHITKGDPVRIFIIGKEEAKLDLEKLTITVRRLKPYPEKILTVDRHNNFFQINDRKEFNKTTDLEVTTKVENKDEIFKFKIKNNAP